MGSGAYYHVVGSERGVSKHTVERCIKRVSKAIVLNLFNEEVRWPTDDIEDVPYRFRILANFPRIAGVVDGTLINIDAPHEDEDAYVDRHGNHSINAMVVCGPDLSFYYANSSWPGSVSDARVLRNSKLAIRMENGWRPFPNAILLGDSIYAAQPWMITPVLNGPLTPARERFLRAHRATRRTIECAIGGLKEKFPCLNHLRLQPTPAGIIFLAAIVLYNLEKRYQQSIGNITEIPQDEHPDLDIPVRVDLDTGTNAVFNDFISYYA